MKTFFILIMAIITCGCSAAKKTSATIDSEGRAADAAVDQHIEPAYMFVSILKANIRVETSVTADVVTQIRMGTKVKILERKEDWFQIEYQPGKTGWCHRNALAVSDQK